jgi:hypothetical protein
VRIAVVAHAAKTLGTGLPGLRRALRAEGVEDPLWVLGGGDGKKVRSFDAHVEPGALRVCVPHGPRSGV